MPFVLGGLFALGLAALLLALATAWSTTTLAPLVALGLVCFATSWVLLLARYGRAEEAVEEASTRLDAWAVDLQHARAALDDAERTLGVHDPASSLAPLFHEVLGRVRTAEEAERAMILDAYAGLVAPRRVEVVPLGALLDRAIRLTQALVPGARIEVERSVEPHGPVALAADRVVGILVQVLAAAHAPGEKVTAEVVEWQAGLLRIRITSPADTPPEDTPRRAGLRLAASQARVLAGSLEWERVEDRTRYVLLLPLAEADVRTDPTPPMRTRRP